MKGKRISIVGSLCGVWDTEIVRGTNRVGDPNKNMSKRNIDTKCAVTNESVELVCATTKTTKFVCKILYGVLKIYMNK